jgi:hypothetical protein
MEFACTASLFLLALPWGPSGLDLAWTISFFVLMFPGFWYAGQPIGLRIGAVFAVIWKFFVASVVAGVGTALIIRAVPGIAVGLGGQSAFVRMVSVSFAFFALYLGGVIALHQGLKPLRETVGLLRDLLPERRAVSPVIDAEGALAIPIWREGVKPRTKRPRDAESKP